MKNAILFSAAALFTGVFADSYIPSGISTGCSTFLTSLNTDANLATCLNSLVAATSAFSGSNASPSDVTSALPKLCAQTSSCSNTATRSSLTSFWNACTAELSGADANDHVLELYDLLYDFTPMRAAVCATDTTTNNFCVNSLKDITPASSKRRSLLKARDDPTVDTGALSSSGAPFLYMLPSSSSNQLCTSCGRSVLQAYITWEATIPYGPGLLQSPILGQQGQLWNAVGEQCGQSFLDTITANAGAAPLAALAGSASDLKAPAALVALFGGAVALLM